MAPSTPDTGPVVAVDGRQLRLSRLDKVLYPQTGTTKAEILDYYARIHPLLARQLKDRPLTRRRWPDGVDSQTTFFEKNLTPGTPDWIPRVTLPTPGSSRQRQTLTFPLIDSVAALTWMANLATVELHTPQWRIDNDGQPRHPDRLVIDLDPGAPAGLAECAEVALWLRERMQHDGLSPYPVTSGSKGMQIYAAVAGTQTAAEVTDYVRALAQEVSAATHGLAISTMNRAARPRKVLVDINQNAAAKTTITPFSLRGTACPQVAAPRTWQEVESPGDLAQLRFEQVLDRIGSVELPDPAVAGPKLP